MNHPGTSCHPSAEGNFVPQQYGCSSHIRCKGELRPRWERTKFPSVGGVARYRAPRDVSRGWLGRGGKRVRNYPLTLLSFGGFLSNLGASKVLRRADARLASQPCGFSPLCFKAQQKKSTIRWIFIKLWCEQSTSPRWTHGSPRNPAGSRPFALNSATKKSTIRWIFIKPWCEQSTSPR